MNAKPSVRVIKRDQKQQNQEARKNAAAKKTTQETARDMVATVSGWVNELQQKQRSTDAVAALRVLFGDSTPQTS